MFKFGLQFFSCRILFNLDLIKLFALFNFVFIVVVELIKKHRVDFFKLFQDVCKHLEIVFDQVITTKASLPIDDEVILLLIKKIVFIKI